MADSRTPVPSLASLEPTQRFSLKHLALRSSAIELGSYGAEMVLRIGSNLVLTRLLFPEAFGLLALVHLLIQGLILLSDVGLGTAIIQNDRGDEQKFLDTVWSIQAARGAILYGLALAFAFPWAWLYGEPALVALVAVGAFVLVLNGFRSTSTFSLRRHLHVGRANAIELGAQVGSVCVMIPVALVWPSPWALVFGSLTGATIGLVLTHWVDVGYKNRFAWDPEVRRLVTHFGKWILAATAIDFLSRQGDRLVIGRLLGVAELGVYSIAVTLSEAVSVVVTRLTHGVAFPLLSRTRREQEARLSQVYYKVRLGLDALALPALGALTVLAPALVELMYDDRYRAAGWILSVLSVRVALVCILTPCETCLFALGKTRYGLHRNVARLLWLALFVPIGWHFAELPGIVWAVATSELPVFFVLWPAFIRTGLFRFTRELLCVPLFGVGYGLAWLLLRFVA